GSGSKTHLGGIIGFTETSTCIITCDGCTNTGSISGANGKGTIGGIHGYSCNPNSTFTNFTIGKDVVLTSAAGGKVGLAIGAGYVGEETNLKTDLTGKVKGGKIVAGETTTEATAENYKDMLAGAGFVGSVDGVTFGE
ncbi:MAG: hypothetical protein II031_01065, partial [Bacteroidales bacterium]|nr:hypothetical protein [Bacteroidales bacterium]